MEELETIDESSLERFLARWYGVTRSRRGGHGESVPPPLATWFDLIEAGGERVTHYYRVRQPGALAVTDGMLVFCDDPAGEFEWACGLAEPDPMTFERMPVEPAWRDMGFPLSTLLVHIAVAGAVLAARTGLVNTDIAREDFGRATAHLRKLRHPVWSWPDPHLSYYYGDRLLAFGGHGGDPAGWQLVVGAQDDKALSVFDDVEWEWDSRSA